MTKIDETIKQAADNERLIQQAVQFQKTGDLPRADLIYKQILLNNPRHGDALNLRGLLAYQVGELDKALTLVKAALGVSPKNGQYFANLAFIQEVKGDLANAERSFKKAIKYQPDHAEAWNNYATLLQKQDRLEEAETAYCEAIAHAPNYLQAYYNLGVMLLNCGAYEKAALIFQQALAKMPDNTDLLLHYGVSLQGDGKLNEATSVYEKILELAPEYPSALVNLASVAMAEDNMEAVRDYSKRAIAAAPDNAGAWNNLGNAYLGLADYDQAETAYRHVLELVPGVADIYGSLATVYKNTNRLSEAEVFYRQALSLAPDDPRHQYQLSLCLQALGKFGEAWPLFEAGFACGERYPDFQLAIPRWKGQPLSNNEKLYLWAEQGVGDELLMAAMIPDLLKIVPNCLIECDARLVELFARSFPTAKILPKGSVREGDANYQIPFGGLYEYLRSDIKDFPAHKGFLIADADKKRYWQDKVAELGVGLKVGICWTSELKSSRRLTALSDLKDWSHLLSVANVQFVNLQYGDQETEIVEVENATGRKIHKWDELDLKLDLDSVAALIQNLDLVITIGTSVHNLAGGIGCECWTLLRTPQETVQGIDYLPSYPAMRLYTKTHDQNWPDILNKIKLDLINQAEL